MARRSGKASHRPKGWGGTCHKKRKGEKDISGEDTVRSESTEVRDRMVCIDGSSWRQGHNQRRRYLNAVSKFGALLYKQWGTIKDFKHREW